MQHVYILTYFMYCLLNCTVYSFHHVHYNNRMAVNNKLRCEEVDLIYHPGIYLEKQRVSIRYQTQDSKEKPPEFKSVTLPLKQVTMQRELTLSS